MIILAWSKYIENITSQEPLNPYIIITFCHDKTPSPTSCVMSKKKFLKEFWGDSHRITSIIYQQGKMTRIILYIEVSNASTNQKRMCTGYIYTCEIFGEKQCLACSQLDYHSVHTPRLPSTCYVSVIDPIKINKINKYETECY